MTITSRSQLAIKAMLNLALAGPTPTSLTDLSRRLDISLSYLEQIFALLRKADLTKGVRGPGGGYVLSKQATEISIDDILTALNQPEGEAVGGELTDAGITSPGELAWLNFDKHIHSYLSGVTLADIMGETASQILPDKAADQVHVAA